MIHDYKVSVIIPSYNEEKFIKSAIDRILDQDYNQELIEVIVVDGLSTDSTPEILDSIAKNSRNIQILTNTERTVPFALNMGIKRATGEIIIRLDAHAEVPVNYISVLVHQLVSLQAANVGGLIDNIPPNASLKSKGIAMACSSKIGMGNSYFRTGADSVKEVDTVPFGCFWKSIFSKIGLFDPELTRNQDDELNARIKGHGGKIYLIPELKITYYTRDSFGKLWRMFYQYGLFKPLVSKKIGKPTTLRQLVPPLFVLSIITLVIFSFFHLYFGLLLLFEIALYESAILISGWKIQKKPKSVTVLLHFLISIYVIHFAYGIGYLNGIKKFVLFGNAAYRQNIKSSR